MLRWQAETMLGMTMQIKFKMISFYTYVTRITSTACLKSNE